MEECCNSVEIYFISIFLYLDLNKYFDNNQKDWKQVLQLISSLEFFSLLPVFTLLILIIM